MEIQYTNVYFTYVNSWGAEICHFSPHHCGAPFWGTVLKTDFRQDERRDDHVTAQGHWYKHRGRACKRTNKKKVSPPQLTRVVHGSVHPDGQPSNWLLLNQNSEVSIHQPITVLQNTVTFPCNWPDWWRILTSSAVIGSNQWQTG